MKNANVIFLPYGDNEYFNPLCEQCEALSNKNQPPRGVFLYHDAGQLLADPLNPELQRLIQIVQQSNFPLYLCEQSAERFRLSSLPSPIQSSTLVRCAELLLFANSLFVPPRKEARWRTFTRQTAVGQSPSILVSLTGENRNDLQANLDLATVFAAVNFKVDIFVPKPEFYLQDTSLCKKLRGLPLYGVQRLISPDASRWEAQEIPVVPPEAISFDAYDFCFEI